ncbi:hypothetical protein C8Q73DRAFT_683461 [Cubamyces lactineus]|nr:hypothetical protein C8Q73DRAFT_683461 [Cubamyces lactineus]
MNPMRQMSFLVMGARRERRLGFVRTLQQLHLVLSHCASGLEVLRLGPYERVAEEACDISMLPSLPLPGLQELYVYVDQSEVCLLLCAKWTMPALRRLTTLNTKAIPHALLEAHGSQLRYLNLYPQLLECFCQHSYQQDLMGIERVPVHCPSLEHLVFAAISQDGLRPLFLNSCSLRYLDIWTTSRRGASHLYGVWPSHGEHAFLDGSSLPALRGIRYLWELHIDLPTICDPGIELSEDEDEGVVYFFPRAQFLQTKRHVISDRMEFCGYCEFPRIAVRESTPSIQMPDWVVESSAMVPVTVPLLPGDWSSSVSSGEGQESDCEDNDLGAGNQNARRENGCLGSGTDSDRESGSYYEPGDEESDYDDFSGEEASARESDAEAPGE